jgi:hypothetical protein
MQFNDLVIAAGGTGAFVAILAVAMGFAVATVIVSLAITARS